MSCWAITSAYARLLKLNDECSRAFQIACALGYDGPAFALHPDRRVALCAVSNARYARI